MAMRKIEIFTAGCPACDDTVRMVEETACPSCDVQVLDMKEAGVADRARTLGVRSVPAIAVDGRLAGCCAERGPDPDTLKAAGLGQPID